MTLGIPSSYSVAVIDRFTGAPLDLGSAVRLEAITVGRRRTSTAEGIVSFAPTTMPHLARLAAHPRRHELAIWRDSTEAFIGPVFDVSESDENITIRANDRSDWMGRRTLDTLDAAIEGDMADVARYLWTAGLKWPGDEIPHTLYVEQTGTSTTVSKWTGTRPYAASELRRLTGSTMTWTVCGHRVFVWSIDSDRKPLAIVSPDQIGVSSSVSTNVTNSGSRVIARNGSMVAMWPPAGTVDEVDGVAEIVLDGRGISSFDDLLQYAKDQWELLKPPIITLGLASGTVLPPTFPLSFDECVPGVRIATQTPPGRNLTASGVFELDRFTATIGTAAGSIPRDAASGRFVAAGTTITESVSASWTPVAGKVTI